MEKNLGTKLSVSALTLLAVAAFVGCSSGESSSSSEEASSENSESAESSEVVSSSEESSESLPGISSAEDFSSVLANGGDYALTADLALSETETSVFTKDTSIDLGGKTLTFTISDATATTLYIKDDIDVTFTNGSLVINSDGASSTLSAFYAEQGTLTFDGVTYTTSDNTGILIDGSASLVFTNSTMNCGGAFGIATNAADGYKDVDIEVSNSTINVESVEDPDNCGIIVNVGGKLSVKDTTISSGRQQIIVRGGTAELSNVTLIKAGNLATETADLRDAGTFATGNELPQVGIFLGNGNQSGYNYDTNVTFSGAVTFQTGYSTTNMIAMSGHDYGNVALTTNGNYVGTIRTYDFRSDDSAKTFTLNGTEITDATTDGTSTVTVEAAA
jgi:hypothetical protein